MASYTVRRGDTLFSIARRFGTTVEALARTNRIGDPSHIEVGQVLRLPNGSTLPPPAQPAPRPSPGPTTSTYTVRRGDTLFDLARRFRTSVDVLVRLNRIPDRDHIEVGQVLRIPAVPPPPSREGRLPSELFGPRANDPALMRLVPVFDRWADAYRVPRELLKALAFVESAWRADAISPSGAIGIGQLLPSTAAWVNQALLGGARLDPRRADDNIRLSARYLRYLLDNTANDSDAVAAYFQGLGSLRRDGMKPQTAAYLWKVMANRVHFA